LTYNNEAMILVEMGEPSLREKMFDLKLNQESLMVSLNLIIEFRDKSRIREEACMLRAT